MSESDSRSLDIPKWRPLALAAIATGAVVFLLMLTEVYDPAGSPYAPMALLLLIAAHWRLLKRAPDEPGTMAPWLPPVPTTFLAAGIVVAASGWFAWNAQGEIFRTGVSPFANAQLGLVVQAAERLEQQEDELYADMYPRGDEATERNGFPVGLILPFAIVSGQGFDWRYASLVAVMLMGGVLTAGTILLGPRDPRWGESTGAAALAVAVSGAAWLLLPQTLAFLNWAPTLPLWPVIAAFGLSIAARSVPMVALNAGILAAMNPGWIVMAPLVAAFLWREERRHFAATLALIIVPPLIGYGAFREFPTDMWRGVIGNLFAEGKTFDAEKAWRFASLHGLGEFLSMRPAIYVAGLLGLGFLVREMLLREDRRERIGLIAVGAFVLLICGPVAHRFHWMAHGVLLAGLLPAVVIDGHGQKIPLPRFRRALITGTATATVISLFLAARLLAGYPTAINRDPAYSQHPSEFLLTGFNVNSEDHVWGAKEHMATGFMLDRRMDGILELSLATLGGDFTPFNPVDIYVNGKLVGVYRDLPGEFSYATVYLAKEYVHFGFNSVVLEAAWKRSPRSYNVSTDPRTVSVMLRGMRFIPMEAVHRKESTVAVAVNMP